MYSIANSQAGKIAFLRCAACHSLGTSAPHKIGSDLKGIIDADAARIQGFTYSDAMKKSAAGGLKWNLTTLKRWIENPSTVVPSTTMVYANSLMPGEIDALIAYIATIK